MTETKRDTTRVALFADSYLEVDGAAMTCRRLVDYARDNSFPMLCVHAGQAAEENTDGTVTHHVVKRSAVSIPIDQSLSFDPLFLRKLASVDPALDRFRPDVIHITGLNDISVIGCLLAWRRNLPLLASWHTNLHEFAAERLRKALAFTGIRVSSLIAERAEKLVLEGTHQYYRIPKVVLAPNHELVDQLALKTRREARLMGRGVDAERFSPAKRTVNDGKFRIGFVGRLRPEKKVAQLIEIERKLHEVGCNDIEFLVAGEGSERETLEKGLKNAVFTGFIDGEKLSEAYANMDVFAFPSETDAFGNVVQEAMASGVPAIVSEEGGPKFIIADGVNGFVARNPTEFSHRIIELKNDPVNLEAMRLAARKHILSRSWVEVFDGVYDGYQRCIYLHNKANAKRSAQAQTGDDPTGVFAVTRDLIGSPIANVLLRWNWKSAILSALLRSPIFFTAYLAQKQGLWIAFGAMCVQFVFRVIFGGINGSILQSYSKVLPAWQATITVPLALAVLSHAVEFGLQAGFDAATGSDGKRGAVMLSIGISMISALFNLFAMRRGVMLVKDERSQSIWKDLAQMPKIAFEFLSFPFVWTWKRARGV